LLAAVRKVASRVPEIAGRFGLEATAPRRGGARRARPEGAKGAPVPPAPTPVPVSEAAPAEAAAQAEAVSDAAEPAEPVSELAPAEAPADAKD
jgi:hypothetical protein